MAGKDIQPRPGGSRKGANVEITFAPVDEKIPVEIRDIIRVRPRDFAALKSSYEEWAARWL